MANLKAPCEWCKFGQVFNGQLGHLYKLGDWKIVESWPMLKFKEGSFLQKKLYVATSNAIVFKQSSILKTKPCEYYLQYS